MLLVYPRQELFREVCLQMHGAAHEITIEQESSACEPMLEQLSLAVMAAIDNPTTASRHYLDGIVRMLATHLARCSSALHECNGTARPSSTTRFSKLCEYIEEHLDADLRVEMLAEQVGMSPLYVARAFKREIGQAPHQYILKRRLARARKLIAETDHKLSYVALVTGFSSQSHLSSIFKRDVGVSPSMYRSDLGRYWSHSLES